METAPVHALRTAAPLARPVGAPGRLLVVVALAAASLAALVRTTTELAEIVAAYRVVPVTPPASVSPLESLTDATPVVVTTTTAGWEKIRLPVTVDRVLHDRSLWRKMHFEDWDRVPRALRELALDRIVRRYADALHGPATWRATRIEHWDAVPQPVRAIAYLRMVAYWTEDEGVGTAFGLDPRQLGQTIGAIVMAESWFEHRAVNENAWGNRDLGLAQCSDYCRDEIAGMAERGEIDFAPAAAEYFYPLVGTRVATVWFARELDRAAGDVELAIRAYHRGIDDAYDERGDAYLDRVVTKRRRYVRNIGAPPAWSYLVGQARLFSGGEHAGEGRGAGAT